MNAIKKDNPFLINTLIKLVVVAFAVPTVLHMATLSIYFGAGLAIMFIMGIVFMSIPDYDDIALLVCTVAVLATFILNMVFYSIPQNHGIKFFLPGKGRLIQ